MHNQKEGFKLFAKSKYAWPGGYPMFALTSDGACLCHQCCIDHYRLIMEAQNTNDASGWNVEAVDVNWEDNFMSCEHCGDSIESAYGEESCE